MSETRTQTDRQILIDAQQKGRMATMRAFLKLSGPGWLQSAITLGGGSLASSLYLGILAGFAMMWLQPLAMILGIIMLSAIGYVTLSTGERPFRAINQHINPVLGWGWAFAVAAANIVWCLPQFSLATGVLTKNLLPGFLGEEGFVRTQAASALPTEHWLPVWIAENANKLLIAVVILIISTLITWSYHRGGRGTRIYETVLKVFVGIIVLCFFGVVVVMSFSGSGLPWRDIFSGLVPDFGQIVRPAATFTASDGLLTAIQNDAARDYWSEVIVNKQRDVIISAAATAVGINMTFLFPYSLLRKGWTREFRGLTIFDLTTGMFIPFVLATGCVVIAAGATFHAEVTSDFVIDEANGTIEAPERFAKQYQGFLDGRNDSSVEGELELAERKLAAALVDRKANDLSGSLDELTGPFVGNYVFGIGVLAMTLSTITILMLISGFVFSEILGFPQGGWSQRIGSLLAGLGGMLGPFIWGGQKASFYLAVPTSVFGFVLLPFAYVTFFLLFNQRGLLGDSMPRGFRRLLWNTLMLVAATTASVGSIYMIWIKAKYVGIAAVSFFVLLAIVVQVNKVNEARYNPPPEPDKT